MNDYSDIINNFASAAPTQAAATVDANPDQAARAVQLSSSTGVPAPAIYGDVDGFEAQHKASLAASIVGNNPQLQAYIQSHPLASAVSNDDWGNLDRISQIATKSAQYIRDPFVGFNQSLAATIGAPVDAVNWMMSKAGLPTSSTPFLGTRSLESGMHALGVDTGEDEPRDVAGTLLRGAGGGVGSILAPEVVMAGIIPKIAAIAPKLGEFLQAAIGTEGRPVTAAIAGAGFGAAQAGAEYLPIPEAWKPIAGMATGAVGAMGTVLGIGGIQAATRAWLHDGLLPPHGVNPAIDSINTEANRTAVEQLDQVLTAAMQSSTRDRSSELTRNFVQQHYGDASIGIHGDGVAALYGDTEPTPDDGLLGWVPGIQDKLALARETGADVHIPVADWVSKVDPAVANTLHDDIRMWPGGITAREAADPVPPKEIVDAPLPQTRGTSSLEPMFAVGDRKLSLAPVKIADANRWAPEGLDVHTYNMMDENGQRVGELELIPDESTKTLHVQMINGAAGMWANSFGPSLVRDLKRQLRDIYPDFDKITGYRVSGARYEAAGGVPEGEMAHPVVKLDAPEGMADTTADFHGFRQILDNSWQNIGGGVSAQIQPKELWSEHESEIADAVADELQKSVPGANLVATHGLYYAPAGISPLGMYLHDRQLPTILYNLSLPDALGTARHEAIHYLKNSGFFTQDEWGILSDAALREGWLDRYRIRDKYPDLGTNQQVEESIAEGYREWAQAQAEGRTVDGPVSQIFQKLKDFLDRIHQRISEILGGEPTADQLFERVQSGEIGGRGASPEAGFAEPKFALDDRFDNLRANAAGLDLASYRKIQAQIEARYAEDIEAATARAEKEQKRTQTKEWKSNRADMAKQVEETIRQRPDVASDLFVSSGELYGQKLRQRYPLREDDLTPEQQAALPNHYYAKSGLPVDDVARMFGYGSGDEMVDRLAQYNAAKEGRTPQEMLRKTIDDETDRQMQARYGQLGENIMDAAKDQALSETNLNILAEEMYAAGIKAGQSVIDKDVAKAWAKEQFSKMTLANVSSERLMANMAKHGRDAERALIGGNPASALRSMQAKYISAVLASEARKFEREVTSFDKQAKQLSARVVKSMEPEYTNFIHQILIKIGKPVRRSIQDLEENIAGGSSKNLADFVADKQSQLREIPIAEQLFDDTWRKDYKSLTVDEFRGVRDSIKALAFNGRDELKVYRAGEAADLAEIKGQMIDQLKDMGDIDYTKPGGRRAGFNLPRTVLASHLQLENIFNHWDQFDPHGVWNQYGIRDLIEGTNQEEAWKKEYAAKLHAIKDDVDTSKTINNTIFRQPDDYGQPNGPLIQFTRANLRAVILNMGNDSGPKSNLRKLAKGYSLDPDTVTGWVHANATKEDWDWAQKIWDMYEEIRQKADTMYRNQTGGVPPQWIPAKPVQTPFGTYQGGYYPVIWHPTFEGTSKKLLGHDPLEQENYVRAAPPAGYTKGRTGYAAPMALTIDQMPNRIAQELHDIAMRPAVVNASKIFYDADIRRAVKNHVGEQYSDLLVPYLHDVANVSNFMSKSQAEFNSWSGFIRQNLISTLVGVPTAMKHFPTALGLSLKEVGLPRFADAVKSLFSINSDTGESNYQFAMENSQELQRRDRNWVETLYGATGQLEPTMAAGKFGDLRSTIMQFASKPIALSDKISAVPTWLAEYRRNMEQGATHGDAVYMADRAVRRAHGSTAITNRPQVMRDQSPWLTSVYNFFNDVMNRQVETLWKAGDTFDLVKDGEWDKAKGMGASVAAGLFAYVVWPALVEQAVSPIDDNPQDSWGKKAALGVGYTLSSSWIGVRDVVNAWLSGHDPQAGMLGTAFKGFTDVARDLNKQQAFSQYHAGKILRDGINLGGMLTGLAPAQIGKAVEFTHDVAAGVEHPRGPWGWLVGLRYGTLKHHSSTLENYLGGKSW